MSKCHIVGNHMSRLIQCMLPLQSCYGAVLVIGDINSSNALLNMVTGFLGIQVMAQLEKISIISIYFSKV